MDISKVMKDELGGIFTTTGLSKISGIPEPRLRIILKHGGRPTKGEIADIRNALRSSQETFMQCLHKNV